MQGQASNGSCQAVVQQVLLFALVGNLPASTMTAK
jgi:hypothetical protein